MTTVREAVLAAIGEIAPELDPAALDPAADLREQADLDSMDYLNLVVAIGEATGVEVAEEAYGRLDTIDAIVDYVAARAAAGPR
jgi:acyl carrier protein